MNINLAAAATKQRKNTKHQKTKNIRYGLNDRKNSQPHKKSVFSNCDSSSDEDTTAAAAAETSAVGGRRHVNRALVAEQVALRNRAEMTMALSTSNPSDLFDYDGQYESFSLGHQNEASKKLKEDGGPKKTLGKEKKESRYVADLLQHAKIRQQEREIIEERKIAKEQAEDEKEFIGKEKFVTKTYKRKLAERESWLVEEEERSKKEQAEDVTKQKNGSAVMASFYGNLTRNIAMGAVNHAGEVDKTETSQRNSDTRYDYHRESDSPKGKTGTSDPESGRKPRILTSSSKQTEDADTTSMDGVEQADLIVKILGARERYFHRKQ